MLIKTIVCSFEDNNATEMALSELYRQFRGEVRVIAGEPGGLLQSMSNSAAPIREMVTIFCSHEICEKVVRQIGLLGAERIYY